jgi:polar amino acid transport system substrate-binding protein
MKRSNATESFVFRHHKVLGTTGAVLGALVATMSAVSPAAADVLDDIKASGKLELGYREDAKPFSFKDESGKPAGFTVTLCEKVAEDLKTELNLPNLTVQWIPVKLEERTTALQQGKVSLFCGADSVTLERRKDVSFSLPIFGDGIGAVVSSRSQPALREVLEGQPSTGPFWRASPARILSKKTVAVVEGTTAEKWVAGKLQELQLDARTLPVKDYKAGIESVSQGNADVFFGDRAIIIETAESQLADGSLIALERQFTNEPLAIALPRNNDALRLVVDRTLSHFYASKDFIKLYTKWFGAPGIGAVVFYTLSAQPD